MSTPDLATLPAIPRDAEGPVFRAPWEAQAFAMAVTLHERGHFTWREWAGRLAAEIGAARANIDALTTEIGRARDAHAARDSTETALRGELAALRGELATLRASRWFRLGRALRLIGRDPP